MQSENTTMVAFVQSDEMSCEIASKEYPVYALIDSPIFGTVPLVDIPVMSDERWHELAAKSKAQRPEYCK